SSGSPRSRRKAASRSRSALPCSDNTPDSANRMWARPEAFCFTKSFGWASAASASWARYAACVADSSRSCDATRGSVARSGARKALVRSGAITAITAATLRPNGARASVGWRIAIDLRDPALDACIRRHAPISARRQGDLPDLGCIRRARTFELIVEEPAHEDLQPALQHGELVSPREGHLREVEDARGRRAVAHEMIEVEIVQFVGTDRVLRELGDFAFRSRGQELGRDRRFENRE